MAKNRELVEKAFLDCFKIKLNNYLKHCVCRSLKIEKIEKIEITQKNYIGVLTVIKTPIKNLQIINLIKTKDLENLESTKKYIENIKNKLPQEISNIEVTNIKDILNDLNTTLSIKDIPESFYLERLPYRQLQIKSNEKRFFLDLCTKSYQKVLSKLQSLYSWPAQLNINIIKDCFKRKELITLLLYLSQSLI